MTIVDIILLIKNLLPNKNKDMFSTYGVTPEQVNTILKKVAQNPEVISDPIELQRQIGYYKNGEKIANHAYIDNGQIVLNFNGTILTKDDIDKMAKEGANQLDKSKKEASGRYFQKPKKVDNLRGW